MDNLRQYVGTPSAIIAFETAGRHLNFTRAAEELNVSQPAISRQIRNLEQHIGKPLFVRRGNNIQFTQYGRLLFEATNASFKNIIATIEQINDGALEKALVLRSQPIILSTFVLPLLVELQHEFPNSTFDIQARNNVTAIDNERATISILYGEGNWPGMKSELLFNDVYFPVCHPLTLNDIENSTSKMVLENLPLLQMSKFVDPWMDWRHWGTHFGVEGVLNKRPQLFNDYEMLLQACRSGQGAAIGALFLVEAALAEGSLVRISDLAVSSNFGFYFVYHPALTKNRDFNNVLSWLRFRAEKTQQRCLSLVFGP